MFFVIPSFLFRMATGLGTLSDNKPEVDGQPTFISIGCNALQFFSNPALQHPTSLALQFPSTTPQHVLHSPRLARNLPNPLLPCFQPSLRVRRPRVKSLDRQSRDSPWREAEILLHLRFRIPRCAYVSACQPRGLQNRLRLPERDFHHRRLQRR